MNQLSAFQNHRMLIIDDNRAIHGDFRKILIPHTLAAGALEASEAAVFGEPAQVLPQIQYEIDSAWQGEEGVAMVQRARDEGRPYALAFVDVRMPPGWDGVETARKIWAVDPEIQVVLCTAYSDYSWDELFQKLGQQDGLLILKKPFDPVEALQMAHALTEKWSLRRQARQKMGELESLVAERTQELQATNHTLRQQQNELRVLFDLMPATLVFKGTENNFLRVNQRFAETTGKSVAQIEGRSTLEIFPREAARFDAADLEVIRSAVPVLGVVETVPDRAGKERWLETDKVPVCDQDGKVSGLIVMAQDITVRKRAEAELQWKTAFLEAQVIASLDAIIVVDPHGKKLLQNQMASDVFQIPPEIANESDEGRQLHWVAERTTNPEQFIERVEHLNAHQDEISRDEIELKDGMFLDRYSGPVVGRDGTYYGRIWTFRDITERKRAQAGVQEP